jgi:hypothetical protein
MYFGNARILSWDETTAFYTLSGILITLEWKHSGKWKSQHIFLWQHVLVHWRLQIFIAFDA